MVRREDGFGIGNAARSFHQIDSYVDKRLRALRIKRAGRTLDGRKLSSRTRDFFHHLGLHRQRSTVRYPETPKHRRPESSPTSRVRELRTHGFHGEHMETRRTGEGV